MREKPAEHSSAMTFGVPPRSLDGTLNSILARVVIDFIMRPALRSGFVQALQPCQPLISNTYVTSLCDGSSKCLRYAASPIRMRCASLKLSRRMAVRSAFQID